jgi:hydrogenase maturation factor
MCLPETALLVEDHGEGVERWGMVTRDGRTQKVGLAFVPDANLGDILLIHSGQAFRILEPDVGLPEVTPA